MSLTNTITWQPVAEGLPDAELNVLLHQDESGPFEGFYDGEEDGVQVFRDVTGVAVSDVTHWAHMPAGPKA